MPYSYVNGSWYRRFDSRMVAVEPIIHEGGWGTNWPTVHVACDWGAMRASLCGPRVATGILPRLRAGYAGSWALPDSSLRSVGTGPIRRRPGHRSGCRQKKTPKQSIYESGFLSRCRTTRVLVGQVDSCSSALLFP